MADADDIKDLIQEMPWGKAVQVESDGFRGTVVGWYITRENRRGVVLQQDGTRIVHVYREERALKKDS